MAKEERQSAGLNPDGFTEPGGLWDSLVATWRNPRYGMFEFKKRDATSGAEIPCFIVDLEDEEGGSLGPQPWSVGFAADWEASEDGTKMYPVGDRKAFAKDQDFSLLITSLLEAGYPKDKLDTDISVFDGMKVHMVRQDAPERKGKKKGDDEKKRTVPVVDKILEMPGEGKKGSASASKGKGKVDDAAPPSDIDEMAQENALEILGDNPKGMSVVGLIGKVFTKLKKEKVDQKKINAVTALFRNKEFLGNGPWEVAGDKIKLPE